MTTLLALETATEACVCALYHQGRLSYREHLAPRRHGELLLPDAQKLLAEAGLHPQQLDAVTFGCGPGAFTGLRIAAGVAQGIALAHDLPVIPLSTLAILAAGAHRRLGARRILVVQDARMGEVYWGSYRIDDDGLPHPLGTERLDAPQAVRLPDNEPGPWHTVGSGWRAHPRLLAEATGLPAEHARAPWYPCSEDLITLTLAAHARGDLHPAEAVQPVYLRYRVATPSPSPHPSSSRRGWR